MILAQGKGMCWGGHPQVLQNTIKNSVNQAEHNGWLLYFSLSFSLKQHQEQFTPHYRSHLGPSCYSQVRSIHGMQCKFKA